MKTVLLLFVVLAVATGPARALQCHVCVSTSNCKQPQTCPASSRYCRTMMTVESLSGNLVRKECADYCVPNHAQQGQVSSGSATTMCCQGDLCNTSLSGAPALSRAATLGLALALGLLALVLAPSL
ncbi:PREDICTED: lymphocyte antigen 6D [Elephantulus edwardii]|uniref:lymphocyte antigen 6D n=1 Tax=Elephantulus edwardii TaxID=28737 RepID=UPI0003F09363|nr:PREDICTED: lymphocyte antigen 6D [Elephantulus edwardii]